MKRSEAEQLLGGHATGTLTEAERKVLFAAALEQQELFEALLDEEALRELLADPEVKAQLLAALAPAAPPKVVPFWRRTGVLGAAASLIVAATAGLAYLRSPEAVPLPVKQEEAPAPAAKAVAAPAEVPAPVTPARKAVQAAPLREPAAPPQAAEAGAPAPSPQMMAAPATALADSARMRTQAESRRAEAQDSLAKKAEAAPRPVAAAVMEVVGAVAPVPVAMKAKASGGVGANATATPFTPSWTLDALPDGSTQVTVSAPRESQVELLRRGTSGVEVLKLQAIADRPGAIVRWRGQVRLVAGDALDLYVLSGAVADPVRLPETGPVDGFRARIHPAAKKDPAR